MVWILLALLSAALSATVSFVDKYVVQHRVKDFRGMPLYSAVMAIAFGTLMWLVGGRPGVGALNGFLIMTAGAISVWAFAFYFYAIQERRASDVIAFLATLPIYTLILALVLLHELLTLPQLAGFFIILFTIIGFSLDKTRGKVTFDKPFWAVAVANLLLAIGAIIVRFTVEANGFVATLAYESWGLAIGGLILFALFRNIRRAFLRSIQTVGARTLTIMFANEGLYVATKAALFLAISMGPVALVIVLSSTQVFFGVLFGALLTLLLPKLYSEHSTRRELLIKLALAVLMIVGIGLVGDV